MGENTSDFLELFLDIFIRSPSHALLSTRFVILAAPICERLLSDLFPVARLLLSFRKSK